MAKHKNKGSLARRKSQDEAATPRESLVAAQRIEHFEGPIPHPQILKKYNDIVPDGANRIFGEFEAESKHRREI